MDIKASGIEPGQRRLNGPQTTGREYRNLSQSVVPERIQSQTHQRVRNANAGHDLMRARPQQPNPIFIRRCDRRS